MFEIMDADLCRTRISEIRGRFYVYALFKPDGTPFYIGKGLGTRIFAHESEARNTTNRSHKLNTIRSIFRKGEGVRYALPLVCENEADAHALEVMLIHELGRHDLRLGPLTNQTDGGEGVIGLSKETMMRKAANLGGLSKDPDRRVANEFFHNITGPQSSVSIKPLGTRKLQSTQPHSSPRVPSERMARTLVATALATGSLVEVDAALPRRFLILGKPYVIENGVARDMAKAGMITVKAAKIPEDEIFVLSQVGLLGIQKFIPRNRLEDLGVLEPVG